jgi:hypothetical protein
MDIKCTVNIVDRQGIIKQLVGKGFKIDYKSDCFTCASGDTIHFTLSNQYDEALFESADYVMGGGIEVVNVPENTKCISFGGLLGRFDSLVNTPFNDEHYYIYITHVKRGRNKKIKK